MLQRYLIATAAALLAINLAGADIPKTERGGLTGPITVYRESDPFDPQGRHFMLWNQPVMLTELHRNVVNEFIRRPGAGVGRLLPQFVPHEWMELVPESLGDGFAPMAESKLQPPRYDEFKDTLTFADGSKRTVRERIWLVSDQRLMSVAAKGGPAVYLQDARAEHDRMKETVATGKNTPTRKLDDFETQALARIRDGSDVALHSSADEMRMLGAIRARNECLECHKTDVGSLLGVFSYTLTLQSPATPEADCLKDLAGLSRTTVGAVKFVESQGGKAVRSPGGLVTEVNFTHTWTRNMEKQAKAPARSGDFLPPFARLKNSSLDVLESFPDLRVLDISHSMVTDDGLKTLARLKSLRKVLYSPGIITEAGLAELKKALPECAVERKQEVVPVMLP